MSVISMFREHIDVPTEESTDAQKTSTEKPALAYTISPGTSTGHDGTMEDSEDLDRLIACLDAEESEEPVTVEEWSGAGAARKVPDDHLVTDPEVGLSENEVVQRRKIYGLNRMEGKNRSHIRHMLSFFVGPIQFVMQVVVNIDSLTPPRKANLVFLQAACILAAFLKDWVDFGVIIGLLLLNAIVGFAQDFKAGNVVQELQKGLALKCNVRRNSALSEIDATELVPGDIVRLEEGTIVPADGQFVNNKAYLQVDQSAITGESLAVEKSAGDLLYQSSTVKRGEAFMLVIDTGDSTFVGRSAALVNAAAGREGHFTEVLGGIGRRLLSLVVATLMVVWVACFYRSEAIERIFTFTLAVTMIGVPVGLPAVVTTTMAVGAAYLARKKAIVQKLSAIESLAGVEILCSDKTGTLTKNRLSLGEPYTVPGIKSDELMLVACLAASRTLKGLDAIDKAFLQALKHYPDVKKMLPTFKIVEFSPFDPVSKKVSAVVESSKGERIICVKGAPATIMRMVSEAGDVEDEVVAGYNEMVTEFARRGFRSFGIARKRHEKPWDLLGIMPCSDPPRHDTAKTIAEAISLGLKIKILTGDAVGIAKETCRQLSLGQNIYNSEKLGLGGGGDLPGHEFYDFVEAADGFAEVFPQHKYNVVDILQNRGYLVAMTGDGVNDAPSLKKADTGIAVQGASDAARSAADIVFLAPGLSAIIDAIRTSRQIFHRMYAYVVYRIALSLHMEIFLGLWIAIWNDSLSIQLVVFIAIFADIATLAIAYDRAPYSRSPVKWNLPRLWGLSIVMGLILAIGSWICLTTMVVGPKDFAGARQGIIENKGLDHSVLFLEIALTENWLIFITRAGGQPFWTSRPSWQLITAIFLVDAVATVFCIFGWFYTIGATTVVSSPATIGRVWIFSFGVFCAMAGVYYLLADAPGFDRLMHGRWPCGSPKKKQGRNLDFEDLVVALQRTSKSHDAAV
ncbi:plasma membrane H+-ATPase [Lecanora helva]